jgi:hypothetical protein
MALTPLMAGRCDEGLRGGIKAGVKTSLDISRLEAERRRVAGGNEEKRQRSAGVGMGMKLIGGPHMAVT